MSAYDTVKAGTLLAAMDEAGVLAKTLEASYWECMEKMEKLHARLAAACARLAELGEDLAECDEGGLSISLPPDGPTVGGYVPRGGIDFTKPDADCAGRPLWFEENRSPSMREAFAFQDDLFRVCRCLAGALPPEFRLAFRAEDWPIRRAPGGTC